MKPLIGVLLLAFAANSLVGLSESVSITSYVSSTKNALYKKVSEGLMERSTLVKNFNQALTKIRVRYDEAVKDGKLEGLDESEQSAFYYRIVIEEIKNLRNKYALESIQEDNAVDKFAVACTNCANNIEKNINSQFDEMEMLMEEEEEELENELEQSDKLEHQLESLDKEAEMGWSLDAESRANLKARTKGVLADLLANEIKTLVSIIVTTYMGGMPVSGAIGPMLSAISVSLKSKVFEYVMQSVMDVLAGFLGRRIEVDPVNYQLGGAVSTHEIGPASVTPATA